MKPIYYSFIILMILMSLIIGCGGGSIKSTIQNILPPEIEDPGHDFANINAMIDGDIDEPTAAPGDNDAFGNILHITWAKIEVEMGFPPISQGSCRVRATITPMGDDSEEIPVVRIASLVYSVNGGASKAISMVKTDSGAWVADIPSQSNGTHIDFYVRVADNFGNVTTGAMPTISGKVRLSAGTPDIDNAYDVVPDDMDITELAAGFDDDYIYVAYSVQGHVSGGTIEPPYIHVYGVKFTDADVQQSEGLMVGYLWSYVPLSASTLNDAFSLGGAGIPQAETDYYRDKHMNVIDIQKLNSGDFVDGLLTEESIPEAEVTDNVFFGRIRRDGLGFQNSRYVRIVNLTAAMASLTSFMPIPLNCSHYLTLDINSYSFTVGEHL